MSNPNYCVITVAKCDPKFMNKALELTEGFKKEIELKANPISIRYGVMSTGQYAGAIAFFQNYASLADFEKWFLTPDTEVAGWWAKLVKKTAKRCAPRARTSNVL